MSKKYPIVKSGEWVQPIRKGYGMACCDCGLIHRLDFRIVGDKRKRIQFRAWRDIKATNRRRVWIKKTYDNGT